MNTQAHRLIFNQSRGCLMVVGENARSAGGGSCSGARRRRRACSAIQNTSASELGGQTVAIQSGQDTRISGSNVIADQGLAMRAGGNLTIEATQNTQSASRFVETKKSGLFSSGGLSITLGQQQQSTDQQNTQTSAAASTVGSVGGNVTLRAGQTYSQTGSDVLSPAGNIDINAQTVNITEARETGSQSSEQKFKQSGLTLAITSPVLSALQTINSQIEAAGNTNSSRMQALAGANIAFNASQAANAVQAGQAKAGGNAADQAGGVGISISLGASKSQSKQSSQSDSARGSNVSAGGNVNITASGAGQRSAITIQGSEVKAGQTTTLQAEGDINLLAAANTSSESNSSKSSSGSIGVGFQLGAGGASAGVTVSAAAGKGQGAGSGTTYTNTQVSGQRVDLQSGGDTTLRGAVVQGNQVTATVGGNLSIESLQDQSQYNEKNKSAGGSVTFGAGAGGSINLSQSKINSNFQSTTEQTAVRAGDGGFAVNVQGNTSLTGGQITSSQAAIDQGKNSFATGGTLTSTDLQNQAKFEAQSASIGVGTSGGKVAPSGVGIGSDKGSASSTTTAGISGIAGNTAARTGDTSTSLAAIFNKEQVQQEVAAQVAITSEFGKQASKAVGDYAGAKLKEAENNGDQAGIEAWKEGGSNRVALHGVVGGLTGGAAGAAGAAAASAAAPAIEQLQGQLQQGLQNAGLGESASQVIASLAGGATAAGIGAAASGGSVAGGATAFNADMNNRQLHPSERRLAQRLAQQLAREGVKRPDGQPYAAEDIEAQMRLMGVAGQTKPNTMEVLTTPGAIAQALTNDPNLPLVFQGPAGVEQLGQPDWALQQHIISLSRPHPEVPSIYLPSVSAPTATGTGAAAGGQPPSPMARCANADLACLSGVGAQQNAPLTQQTREAIADAAQTTSRGAGVVAAGATAVAAQGGPYGRPAQGVAVMATGVGAAADVVEQLARPNLAASTENAFLLAIQTGADSVIPIAAPITNEVINAWKNSNTNLELKYWASIEWRKFLDSRSKP